MPCVVTHLDLSKLSHISNPFPLERPKVRRDPRSLEVYHSSKRFIHECTNGLDWESTSRAGNGVDHGLCAHVDFTAADDLGHVGGVVGLEDGYLDAFFLVEALAGMEGEGLRGGNEEVVSRGSLCRHIGSIYDVWRRSPWPGQGRWGHGRAWRAN